MSETMETANSTPEIEVNPGLHMDWFLGRSLIKDGVAAMPLTKAMREYQGALWPYADSTLSPIPWLYLSQIPDIAHLNGNPAWLVKDGLVPLLSFLNYYPTPARLKSKLYVASELAAFIPAAWREHILFYSGPEVEGIGTHSPSKCLLMGFTWSSYSDLTFFEAYLRRAQSTINDMKTVEIFLPVRSSSGVDGEDSFHGKVSQLLHKYITVPFEYVDSSAFQRSSGWSDYLIFDANQKLLLGDNSMVHKLIGKGAKCFQKPAVVSEDKLILSLVHGLSLGSIRFTTENEKAQYTREHLGLVGNSMQAIKFSLLSSAAYRSLPWGEWISPWQKSN